MDHQRSQESYPQYADFFLAIYFAFTFTVARFFFELYAYQKLAAWWINWNIGHGLDKLLNEADHSKISKTAESLWKLTCYIAFEAFIYHISCKEPWFADTDSFFHGWPNQTVKQPLKLYYTSQCGFYIYNVLSLLIWEARKKDFSVMMAHHLVALVLIGCSYMTRLFRIGSVVLALHDVTDAILELAKLCKYSGMEICASICFGM
eukprot:c3782_g1_i1 orf=303-917(+)